MNQQESIFGQSPSSAQIIFNAICSHFFIVPNELNRRKLLNALRDSRPETSRLSQTAEHFIIAHAEIASRVLSMEAQAFLTDEQKQELQLLRQELSVDWKECLRRLNIDSTLISRSTVLRKIDALFLSQMEWMKDVGFEGLALQMQIKIFSESPIADLFMKD